RMAVLRPRLDSASGMYASPPVSGSAHRRMAPPGAICARWSSVPSANLIRRAWGSRSDRPTVSASLLNVARMPSLYTVPMTKLTGAAAMALMPFQAVLMDSLALRNASGRPLTTDSSLANTLSRTHRQGAASSSLSAEKLLLTRSFMLVNHPGTLTVTQVWIGLNTLSLIQVQAAFSAFFMPSQVPLMLVPMFPMLVTSLATHPMSGLMTFPASHTRTLPTTRSTGVSTAATTLMS